MRAKRYLKDYRMESKLNSKGSLSARASYVGSYHRFSADAKSLARAKRSYLILTLASVILFVIQLWFTDLIDRDKRYLLLPMSFNALPAFGVVLGVIRLHLVDEQMTNLQRDRICNRLPMFSFLFFFLAALSLVSTVAELLMNGLAVSRFFYAVDAMVLLLLSFRIFTLRKILKTEMVCS